MIDLIQADRELAALEVEEEQHRATTQDLDLCGDLRGEAWSRLDVIGRRRRDLQRDIARAREVNAQPVAASALTLVDRVAGEIGHADAKAGFAAGVQLAVLGAVAGGLGGVRGPLLLVAGALLLVGVVVAAFAVLPRLPNRRTADEGAADWLQFGALGKMDPTDLARWLTSETGVAEAACIRAVKLSKIAHRKYRLIRCSLITGLAGVLTAALAIVQWSW